MRRLALLTAALVAAVFAAHRPAQAAGVLEKVRAAGTLRCGLLTEDNDYSKFDTHAGVYDLGAELCKAVAAAALGGKAKADIFNFGDEPEAMKALAAGQIDLVATASPTPTNGAVYNASFGPTVFVDGQGFLVEKDSGIAALRDLAGKQVCFIANTEAETQLHAALKRANVQVKLFPWEEIGEMDAGLVTGHCAAVTGDISSLAKQRAAFQGRKRDFVFLPQLLTIDPVAPAVRRDDPAWAAIVTWAMEALLQAEASGITQANVTTMRKTSDDPIVQRLLGGDRAAARDLGLADDWAAAVISTVGNYGEIYARVVGPGAEDLPRGPNALWKDGGLLYPLPVR